MNVIERIENTSGYSAISLTAIEAELYKHAGYRLAQFEDGELIELFDPLEFDGPVHALTGAIEWIKAHTGETWLVMCSGFALCEPHHLIADDPASLKCLAEVIHQAFADCCH